MLTAGFLLAIGIIIIVWTMGFLFLNSLFLQTIPLQLYKRILIIFPHPDDEALATGGLMRKAADTGADITWVVLTQGERGTPTAVIDPTLKSIRAREVVAAAQLLRVQTVIQKDFGDGMITTRKTEVTKFLAQICAKLQPDLIITYDRSGWYGHPDHIATADIVTRLVRTRFTEARLWYATLPKRVWALSGNMPIHMAETPKWMTQRTYPTHKVFIGPSIIAVIRLVYLYKSQYQSFRGGFPFKAIPMWFFISMGWFAYYHAVDDPSATANGTTKRRSSSHAL